MARNASGLKSPVPFSKHRGILNYWFFVKKQRTMERQKRSKGRGWESCYVKKIYGTFGVEMRAYGQKLVKFCTHTQVTVTLFKTSRHSKLLFFIKNKGQWNAKSGPKVGDGKVAV